jgi:hypothetical protein
MEFWHGFFSLSGAVYVLIPQDLVKTAIMTMQTDTTAIDVSGLAGPLSHPYSGVVLDIETL